MTTPPTGYVVSGPTSGTSADVARLLLDSTVLIDALRGRPAAERLRTLRRRGDEPWTCAICIEEIWRGGASRRRGDGTAVGAWIALRSAGIPGRNPCRRMAPSVRRRGHHAAPSRLLDRRGSRRNRGTPRDRQPRRFPDGRCHGRTLAGGQLTSCGLDQATSRPASTYAPRMRGLTRRPPPPTRLGGIPPATVR